MSKVKSKIPLSEILKPEIWTCAKCGGKLYVHKYVWKNEIKSINYCPNCWDKKENKNDRKDSIKI